MTIESEHYIIGALLNDNGCIDRISEIEVNHFSDGNNRAYYAEITKQIMAGVKVDPITVAMAIPDSLPHVGAIVASTPGTSMLERHAEL